MTLEEARLQPGVFTHNGTLLMVNNTPDFNLDIAVNAGPEQKQQAADSWDELCIRCRTPATRGFGLSWRQGLFFSDAGMWAPYYGGVCDDCCGFGLRQKFDGKQNNATPTSEDQRGTLELKDWNDLTCDYCKTAATHVRVSTDDAATHPDVVIIEARCDSCYDVACFCWIHKEKQ